MGNFYGVAQHQPSAVRCYRLLLLLLVAAFVAVAGCCCCLLLVFCCALLLLLLFAIIGSYCLLRCSFSLSVIWGCRCGLFLLFLALCLVSLAAEGFKTKLEQVRE